MRFVILCAPCDHIVAGSNGHEVHKGSQRAQGVMATEPSIYFIPALYPLTE